MRKNYSVLNASNSIENLVRNRRVPNDCIYMRNHFEHKKLQSLS